MKNWYKSRTIRLAIFQALAGVIFAFQTQYPELQAAGGVAFLKSLVDIALRLDTDSPVK